MLTLTASSSSSGGRSRGLGQLGSLHGVRHGELSGGRHRELSGGGHGELRGRLLPGLCLS